ncbi:SPFH domain-containing protein [Adlercreutzia sp. ZJ154]|uniref:SPFH domain-containing protein n=1 Tax=Adlercreutzia sp. ZJ154 TaxID=2709790 RepID=UPI0013EDEA5C|nr:SPFH domain-containing protein [Adlercreutzia sp. ZJ154]
MGTSRKVREKSDLVATEVDARGKRFRVKPDTVTEVIGEKASNAGVIVFAVAIFLLAFALCLIGGFVLQGRVTLVAIVVGVIAAALVVSSCHIAQQWERVVVLRLGKLNRVSGPGLFWTWPIIESNTMRVDTRMRVTTFGAEETLTADLVSLDVNAVLFWHVWDAEAACIEVGDFTAAVELSAQTALRDAIGRASAAEVAIRRDQLDRELKKVLEEKVSPWGVTILSVEVRDILLPRDLQEVMSLEAQAEQRKKARIILIEAEQDIFEMLNDMESLYENNDAAMHLRAMHLLNESLREGKGTVVVPSSFSEGFSDVLPDSLKGKM